MLLVDVDNLLHLIVASQEDSTPVVNVLGHNVDHTAHLAVNSLTASYCTS